MNDLRVLHLALGVEESLEKLQSGLASHLRDPHARDAADAILRDGPAHKKLRAAYDKINHDLAAHAADTDDASILEALFEGEQQARSFYQDWAERLRNPELRALFESMAKEEQAHVELIGAQLARLRNQI